MKAALDILINPNDRGLGHQALHRVIFNVKWKPLWLKLKNEFLILFYYYITV